MSGNFDSLFKSPVALADEMYGVTYKQTDDARTRAMADYFGPAPATSQVTAADHYPRTNQTLPDAYRGSNLFVADTIEGLVRTDNEPWTTIILPWLLTDELSIKFNTFEFNRTLPGPTPHEGISRVITSSEHTQSFRSQRYGLAFYMEGDFASTSKGDAQYVRNLIAISQACQELANYGVLIELLGCKSYIREWNDQYRDRSVTFEQIMRAEYADFACCALEAGRIEVIIEKHRAVLLSRRIAADTIVLWPGARLFFSMELMGSRTQYWQMGPDGNMRMERGPDAMGVLRGDIAVFETREFDTPEGGPRMQPLERRTTVGEVYHMSFEERRTETLNTGEVGTLKYQTSQRDIYIYDVTEDNYVRIGFKEAIICSDLFGVTATNARLRVVDELNQQLADPSVKARVVENERKFGALKCGMGNERPAELDALIYFDPNLNGGQYAVAEKFGELDPQVVTIEDLLQTWKTLPEAAMGDRSASRISRADRRRPLSSFSTTTTTTVDGAPKTQNLFAGTQLQTSSIETLLYGAVDTENGLLLPLANAGKTKLGSFFSALERDFVSSKHQTHLENEAYSNAVKTRSGLNYKIATALDGSTPANCSAVREAVVKTIDQHLTETGAFKSGKDIVQLNAALDSLAGVADKTVAAPNTAKESKVLHSIISTQLSLNPYAKFTSVNELLDTKEKIQNLSSDAREELQAAQEKVAVAQQDAYDRVLLHGGAKHTNGVEFDATSPTKWLNALKSSAAISAASPSIARSIRSTESRIVALAQAQSELADAIDMHIVGTKGLQYDGNDRDGKLRYVDGDKKGYLVTTKKERSGLDARGLYVEAQKNSAVGDNYDVFKAQILDRQLDAENIMWMLDNNVHVPFNILIFRLWIRLRMFTGILLRSGYTTGVSAYGHSNFVLGTDVATKMIQGHFTFQYKSHVLQNKAVMHLRNIAPRGYCGGWNRRFIDPASFEDYFQSNERQRASLIAVLVPINFTAYHYPLNFCPVRMGGPANSADAGSGVAPNFYREVVDLFGSYPGAYVYAKMYSVEDSTSAIGICDRFFNEYEQPNTTACLGKHFVYSSSSKNFSVLKEGDGHLSGNRTGKGASAVWHGNGRLFPDQNMVKYSF